MFKTLCIVAFIATSSLFVYSQENSPTNKFAEFGISAGYLNINSKVKTNQFERIGNDSGFFAGIFSNLNLNESFNLQPSLLYSRTGEQDYLMLPLMLNYNLGNTGFNIQAGPQVSMDLAEHVVDNYNKLSWDLGLGLGYDINDKFKIEARYFKGITNKLEGQMEFGNGEVLVIDSSRMNSLQVGLSYSIF